MMARLCATGTKAKPGSATTEFELHWRVLIQSDDVKHYLKPMPFGVGASTSSSSSSHLALHQPAAHPPEDRLMRQLMHQMKQGQEQIASLKRKLETGGAAAKGKGKGKGKDKDSKRWKSADAQHKPPSVVEMEQRNLCTKCSGQPLCFGFNLPRGCKAAAPGQRCPKGWHHCAHGNCQDKKEPHSANSH